MKEQILELIKQYETIIVHRHVRPDPDAYGSQGGLVEMLKTSFPDKKIYAVGQEDESLHYLKRLDVIEDHVFEGALIIVCDTANEERICDRRYKLGDKLVKIDHHPNEDAYGDYLWIDTSASSVSEMIYEFYLFGKDKGLTLSDEGARLLFAGIVGDTGRFLYPSTTQNTFDIAGELIRFDFDRNELFNKMYEIDANVIKLHGYVLQNFEMDGDGCASMIMTKEILEEHQVIPSEASLLVSTLGNVKGIKAWVFFIEESDQIRVRLRSKGPVINTIAKKYNGGGHPLAAGASIYSWEEKEEVMKDLREVCRNHR
ncbi:MULTISPECIES: bifunctional oligoribonuclease/PAP phosphatase NrnA [Rossellomorea]|uniref:Bifunctional oligoribonuclease/PAP phosphatase NrnA n=1 Tax=Rossellomorea aquimaris TaxID=189382 RepID=A0A5D4TLF4_9BACI|nr:MULTISPECIES: bifunctional oligoribonuclease/PAP phosphatase NrnA [Rossellomorea]MDT9025109.1 bifunctional oligoribonuclease/PAP phosphatase NrnA [Rossellomorea sp. YC4-1]TYS75641.1 bifunctional oligoribonuclease/PAP phosphatase NrnA [Rossellomorea aquimaris]TYS87210.1 bifunctional oligoribonuclease/PAP phosphatase NrnA [Rossellomorea aquimaris]